MKTFTVKKLKNFKIKLKLKKKKVTKELSLLTGKYKHKNKLWKIKK